MSQTETGKKVEIAVFTLENKMNNAGKILDKAEKVISQYERMEALLDVSKAYAKQLEKKRERSRKRERVLVSLLVISNICWLLYSMS